MLPDVSDAVAADTYPALRVPVNQHVRVTMAANTLVVDLAPAVAVVALLLATLNLAYAAGVTCAIRVQIAVPVQAHDMR